VGVIALVAPAVVSASPIVYSAGGADATAVLSIVDAFRADIVGSGATKQEINWDGAALPEAPNNMPPDAFKARGVVFATPGSGFQVSARAGNPTATPIEFGNINPAYPTNFKPFSAERIFTALDSTITDVNFVIPGTTTASFTHAFGAVFTDVDKAVVSKLEYFDPGGKLLLTYVPPVSGNESFSFVGVIFDAGEQVGRVRITSGNAPLSANNTESPTNGIDVVAMDDFIFGQPVPEPASLGLIALGLPMLLRRRSR
jgi:hypothetical protein